MDGPAWRALSFGHSGQIKWAYADRIQKFNRHDVPLICNGIEIVDRSRWNGSAQLIASPSASLDYQLTEPVALVNDPSAELPLNLQRDSLASSHPELEKRLKVSLCNDLIAETLARAPEHSPFERENWPELNNRKIHLGKRVSYRGAWRSSRHVFSWVGTGWVISDSQIVPGEKGLLLLPYDSKIGVSEFLRGPNSEYSISWISNRPTISDISSCIQFMRDIFRAKAWGNGSHGGSVWMVCSDALKKRLETGSIPKWLEALMSQTMRPFGPAWLLTDSFVKNELAEDLEAGVSFENGAHVPLVVVKNQSTSQPEEDLPLIAAWKRYIGDTPIPLSYKDRMAAFPLAYTELGDRIRFHRDWFLETSKRDAKEPQ